MLEHASISRHIDPGRPPAAAGGLVSQVLDLVLGPRQPLDSGELQQAGRRDTTRSFGMRSKVCIGWVASAVTPGRRSLEWTSSVGRLRARSRYCHNSTGRKSRYVHGENTVPPLHYGVHWG